SIYNSDYLNSAPILLFNFKNISSSKGSKMLSDEGFALRGGVHCAPLAHENLGTLPKGAIRFSPSIFNNEKQTLEFCRVVKKIASKKN
ncbi:MAG: aminotransferase class V-fold PLP-dependent enzyme, partial [Oscillospiraceae bacterium]|nr:aminotransferase class V-fold PLP-dependent enzyme [Oscillospiraceae bacterium]